MDDYSRAPELTTAGEAVSEREELLRARLASAEHPSKTNFVRYIRPKTHVRTATLVAAGSGETVCQLSAYSGGADVLLIVPDSALRRLTSPFLARYGLQHIERKECSPEQGVDNTAIQKAITEGSDARFVLASYGRHVPVWVNKRVDDGELIVYVDHAVLSAIASGWWRHRFLYPLENAKFSTE